MKKCDKLIAPCEDGERNKRPHNDNKIITNIVIKKNFKYLFSNLDANYFILWGGMLSTGLSFGSEFNGLRLRNVCGLNWMKYTDYPIYLYWLVVNLNSGLSFLSFLYHWLSGSGVNLGRLWCGVRFPSRAGFSFSCNGKENPSTRLRLHASVHLTIVVQ